MENDETLTEIRGHKKKTKIFRGKSDIFLEILKASPANNWC